MRRLLPAILLLPLAGCDDKEPADTSPTPGETGGADTSADDTSDDAPNVCDDYLACLAAVDPDTFTDVVGTYGGDGSCWGDESTAASCLEVCESELADLLLEHPEEVACGGEPPVEADWPFDEGVWDIEFLALSEVDCSKELSDDDLEVLNDAVDGVTLAYEDYPEFKFTPAGGLGITCALTDSDFRCEYAVGGDDEVGYEGTFSNARAASGEGWVTTEECSYRVSFEMAFRGS